MINKLFMSVMEQDSAPIVICDMESVIIYMNASAKSRYHKDLTGSNLKDCHTDKANEKIDKVLDWFKQSIDNNIIYTFYNAEENKDVYMVALRDENQSLIGYYEKHEFRNRETSPLYNF